MIRKTMVFVLCMLLAVSSLAYIPAAIPAAAESSTQGGQTAQPGANTAAPAGVTAKSALLMEQSTGKVLYENNAHEKLPPASITKIMTELLVLEAIEEGSLGWSDQITCSAHAASMGGSDIWLKEGEVMTVKDLFKAMAIGSANDAAVALAEKVGGTEQAFVNMMNEKAKELGMNDTHFVNSNGLDADGHVTSAYDVALMSRELMKHKEIFDYCTVWMDSLRGGKTGLYNTNKLIHSYTGANGLKTGSTGKAGFCVSATANRNNMELIAVVMGCQTGDIRFDSAAKLLDYGFTNWAVVSPKISAGKKTVKVLKGVRAEVEASASGNTSVLVGKSDEKKVTQKVELVDNVMAPVEKGQVLGQVSLWANGKKVGSIPLVAKTAVGKMTFLKAFVGLFLAMISG